MRLVQLTALVYVVGFGTDVFDDGASAEMAREVHFVEEMEADADIDGALSDASSGRGAPRNLGDALSSPAARPGATPLASELIDTDPDGEFGSAARAADVAAVQKFLPKQCIHGVDEKRPKLTRNEQKRTYAVLAHVVKRMKASDEFHKLLQLVAMRESSLQQGLVHRLSADLEASISAWKKTAKLYEGNPHYADAANWQTYGLFGMNSNYFTLVWDNQASPQVLCDAIVDVLVYRRAVARVVRKAGGTIKCTADDGTQFDYTTKATWETVHRAVSGGKLCPSKSENIASIMGKYFRGRALRVGLDPDKPVTLKALGTEPAKGLGGEAWETQEEMVMGLWAELEAEWEKHPIGEEEPAPTKIARRKTK